MKCLQMTNSVVQLIIYYFRLYKVVELTAESVTTTLSPKNPRKNDKETIVNSEVNLTISN